MKTAINPENLADFFVEYVNSGKLEGVVSLYEESAVLIISQNNDTACGKTEIRAFYKSLLDFKPKFEKGIQQPAIINGNIALTSSRLTNGFVTAEIARKQIDGSWLWMIDQPKIAIESLPL